MTSKKQSTRNRILFFLPLILLAACQKPSINFGNNFTNSNSTNIVVVDTVSTDLYTVQQDSFPTAASGTILIGRYKDTAFGIVASASYVEVGLPHSLPTISNLATYDSLVLILRANKTFYGDTTQKQRYVVSQLGAPIQPPQAQGTWFNNSRLPYNPTPLGFSDVFINPSIPYTTQYANDSLKIRLTDAQGFRLFSMIQNQSDTVKSFNSFNGYFKGLYLSPDSNSLGGIYGFRDSIFMRLYYHEPGVTINYKILDFPMTNKSNQFNSIWVNRAGTPLANLSRANPQIPSALTGHVSYTQSITGVQTEIKFPNLWRLPQLPDYLSVLKAVLIVKPLQGSYSPQLALPPQLTFYVTDQTNLQGFPLNVGNGNLVVDYLYGVNTAYTYDVTGYIKQQIEAGAVNNSQVGILMVNPPPANNTTINRAIFGDKLNPKTNIMLKLYYASYFN